MIKDRRMLLVRVNARDILSFAFLVALIILMGGNSQNPDIRNYILGYQRIGYVVEGSYIYSILKNFFIYLGASFKVFRLFLYILGLCNIRYSCRKLNANTVLTYICYGIALMMIDSTQTYNFVGMTFLLVGTAHLIKDESHNRIKYVIAVLLASGFHMVFIFYLPFVFIYRKKDSKQLLKVYIFTTVIVLIFSIVASVSGLASVIQRFLSATGLDSYQSYLGARTRFGHYYPMLVHIISCACSFYCYIKAEEKNFDCKEICRIILLLNLYGVFAFPFFRFQLTLARLTRNLEMFSFVSGIVFIKEQNNKDSRIMLTFALLVLAGIMGYFSVYSVYKEVIVRPFWEYNWILGRY